MLTTRYQVGSMALFLALHVGLVIGLDDALPGRISPLPQEHSPKCRLSKLEESMARFFVFAVHVTQLNMNKTHIGRFKAVGGHLHLLTLKQLKKNYPDEDFFPSVENSCQDDPTYK